MPQVVPGQLSLDVRRPPRSYSEHSMLRTSVDSGRNVHRGIGCCETPTRISMSEGDEEENTDEVDETCASDDVVNETLACEDEVNQAGTGDDVVRASCSGDNVGDEPISVACNF
ncbi:uncharacterized protein DS421_15g500720 [Arachis hypogaea]|nr:uncharacterized protein DS421_15g500720 [Arachis hypogaea]